METKMLGKNVLDKLGNSVTADSNSVVNKEIWIGPQHWKAMNSEKQAVVVDFWHSNRGYESRFPFNQMEIPPKTNSGEKTKSIYDIGITFNVGQGLKEQSILETIRAVKIPHLYAVYDDINKKREAVASGGK